MAQVAGGDGGLAHPAVELRKTEVVPATGVCDLGSGLLSCPESGWLIRTMCQTERLAPASIQLPQQCRQKVGEEGPVPLHHVSPGTCLVRVGDAGQGPRSPCSRPCLPRDLGAPGRPCLSQGLGKTPLKRAGNKGLCASVACRWGPILYFPGSAQSCKLKNHQRGASARWKNMEKMS